MIQLKKKEKCPSWQGQTLTKSSLSTFHAETLVLNRGLTAGVRASGGPCWDSAAERSSSKALLIAAAYDNVSYQMPSH